MTLSCDIWLLDLQMGRSDLERICSCQVSSLNNGHQSCNANLLILKRNAFEHVVKVSRPFCSADNFYT